MKRLQPFLWATFGALLTLLTPSAAAQVGIAYTSFVNVWGADQNLNSHKIINLAAPTSGGDAVNKTYADGLAAVYSVAENVGNLSVTHSVFNTITWSTNVNDSGGVHSTSVNTSRFTVPAGQGGNYAIGCSLFISSDNSVVGQFILRPEVNGAVIDGGLTVLFSPGNGANMGLNGSTLVRLNAADYVEWQIDPVTTNNQNILALASPNYYNPRAWIQKVSQ